MRNNTYFSKNEYKASIILFIIVILLTSCTSSGAREAATISTSTATEKPTATVTHTPPPEPSATATQEPSLTPTPALIGGRLFFDMNGSGLQDKATFYYDPDRIEDERQPLQPDLLDTIQKFLIKNPEIQKGDLVTINEPNLSGFTICHDEDCVITDANGNFVIENQSSNTFIYIKVIDPYQDSRAMQMRFINKWNGSVNIPAYEMNGFEVPEQHLNNTTVYEISENFSIFKDRSNEIGLMQGFLTLPYFIDHAPDFGISNCYDLDTQIGSVRTYSGSTEIIYDPVKSIGLGATGDTHVGIDYEGPEGLFIIDPMGGQINGIFFNNSHLVVTGEDPGNRGYVESYGHLKTVLVDVGETIFRGQITSINGMTNTSHPHLHYGFNTNIRQYEARDNGVDPYMDLIESIPRWEISTTYNGEISEIMIGSPGFFTVVNMPIFP